MIPPLKIKFICLLIGLLANVALSAAENSYLFVTFKGEKSPMTEQIYFALSKDGRQWQALNGGEPVLVSTLGEKGVRDPYIFRSHDGKRFYILATDASIHLNHDWKRAQTAGSQSIVIWESTDLVNWSPPRLVRVAAPDAGCTWAPEAVHDEKTGDYLVFWASKNGSDQFAKQRIWAARTKDFQTFGAPFIYIDKPQHVIDTTIVREGNQYYRFSKDEKFKAITMETSQDLMGPWRNVPGFTLAKMRGNEGPACYPLKPAANGKPATWCLVLDYYSKGEGYQPFITEDLSAGEFKPGPDFSFPFRFRHGSILPVSAAESDRLQTAFAKPASTEAPAPKPILDGFTADPAIRVFGDTYYVYPTSDKPNWLTTDFSVWSSKNLVDWKKEGMILDVTKDLSWGKIKAWAPDCIERDGKFYFYFCAEMKIGVAVSDKPTGPFKDALNRPLLQRGGKVRVATIDPYPFIDSDGQAYLFYGNGRFAQAVRLKPDMITPDGDPVDIPLKDFREGIVVFKRAGKYYFMWSIGDARSPDYRVGWGISDSPLGPVKIPDKDFIVLQKHGTAVGTAHHSVVNVPGTDRWYVAYHRHAIPNGSGYQRETCLVRMEFNPDGSIQPMNPLTKQFRLGDAGEPIPPISKR